MKLTKYVLMGILGFGMLVAGRIVFAELYAGYAASLAKQCMSGDGCEAEAIYAQANQLWPSQSRYLLARASLLLDQGETSSAANLYQQAQDLQPTWPYHSANVLVSYARQGLYSGGQITAAWSHVAATGQTERPVLTQLSRFALRHWYQLSAPDRTSAAQLIQALAVHDAGRLFWLAEAEQRLPLLCRIQVIEQCANASQ